MDFLKPLLNFSNICLVWKAAQVQLLISYSWIGFSKAFVSPPNSIISANTQLSDVPSPAVCCSTSLLSRYLHLSSTEEACTRKEAHLQLVMWYFLLRFKHIWFIHNISSVILVITLVCKDHSCLLSVGSSLVPADSCSFMSRHCTRPGPWFQSKSNIYLVNNVEARVVWSVKPYLTLTSWERKNKQVWMDIQTDRYLLFLSQRGRFV